MATLDDIKQAGRARVREEAKNDAAIRIHEMRRSAEGVITSLLDVERAVEANDFRAMLDALGNAREHAKDMKLDSLTDHLTLLATLSRVEH